MPLPRFDIFALSERMMAMDDATWARHANPLSVYSRMSILPLMTLAVWSHLWLGWGALGPVALVVLWTWWNPRAFGAPTTTNSWAARGTFGERIFLNRAKIPIPAHHKRWAKILTLVSALGVLPWVYGLWQADVGMTLFGLSLVIGGKLWFFDRMVWLYQDMRPQDPDTPTGFTEGKPSRAHRRPMGRLFAALGQAARCRAAVAPGISRFRKTPRRASARRPAQLLQGNL